MRNGRLALPGPRRRAGGLCSSGSQASTLGIQLLEQLKVFAALLHPVGSDANPEVTDKALARLPASVVKMISTAVLLPVAARAGSIDKAV